MSYLERARELALSMPGAWEDHPWGEEPVFKNEGGKIFLFCGPEADGVFTATVKLPPEEGQEALSLPFVSVARYVGRYGWVTVRVSSPFEAEVLDAWVRRSYDLVLGARGRSPRQGGRRGT